MSTAKGRQILVQGCGQLAWGQSIRSPIAGSQWDTGRLDERISFGPERPRPGSAEGVAWVTLADVVDEPAGWRPVEPADVRPEIEIERVEGAGSLVLPGWPDLVRAQARWATEQLKQTGVLVAPHDWRGSARGRKLLEAWVDEGWELASLEEALRRHFSEDVRLASTGGLWLRLSEPGQSLVFANGSETSMALVIAPWVLEQVLAEIPKELASRWRCEEQHESGWFVRQQLARSITVALKEGLDAVELGAGAAPLFGFSDSPAQELYHPLAAIKVTIRLPGAPPAKWWEEVAAAGSLVSPDGARHNDEVSWADTKTVLVASSEIQQLERFLMWGLPRESIDPAQLESALDVVSSPDTWLYDPEQEARAEQGEAPGHAPQGESEELTGEGAAEEDLDAKIQDIQKNLRKMAPKAAPEAVEKAPEAPGTEEPDSATPAAGPPEPPAEEAAGLKKRPRKVSRKPSPAALPPVFETVDALESFQPERLEIQIPHRANEIRVQIDGRPVGQENVRRSSVLGEEGRVYRIEGISVPYGAIVRIDFEVPMDS